MEFHKLVTSVAVLALAGGCDAELPEEPPVSPVVRVVIDGDSLPLVVGEALPLTANPFDAAGTRLTSRTVLWRSLSPNVAIVSNDGLVRAVAPGLAMISVLVESVADTVEMIAEPGAIRLHPERTEVGVNTPLDYEVTLFRSDGRPLAGEADLAWSSSDGTIAIVDGSTVTALGAGTVTVTASSGTREGSAELVVSVTQAAAVAIGGYGGPLICCSDIQLSATVLDGAGTPLPDRWLEWFVDEPRVARVTQDGLLSFIAPGAVEVSVRAYPVLQVVSLTADEGLLRLSTDSLSLLRGGAITVPLTMVDSGGRVVRNSPVATWSSSAPAVAAVDSLGGVSTLGPGTATIQASTPSQNATIELTVATAIWQEVSAAAVFGWHTCAATTTGSVYCWGWNLGSQTGHPEQALPTDVPTPVLLNTPAPLTGLTSGRLHSCGFDASGNAYCWGTGYFGDGAYAVDEPVTLAAGGGTLAAISVASQSTCAIDAGGAVMCWGNLWEHHGQATPLAVPIGEPAIQVAAGDDHNCALGASGAAYCWGSNQFGKLGDGTEASTSDPVQVTGGAVYRQLAVGWLHTCGLVDSIAYCWGNDWDGQLGSDSIPCGTLFCDLNSSPVPVAVQGGLKFAEIAAGEDFTCGLTGDGAAYCWGNNFSGQLGNGSLNHSSTPLAVAGGIAFQSLSLGNVHACGVALDGRLYCWGDNSYAQLGDGTMVASPVPLEVPGSP